MAPLNAPLKQVHSTTPTERGTFSFYGATGLVICCPNCSNTFFVDNAEIETRHPLNAGPLNCPGCVKEFKIVRGVAVEPSRKMEVKKDPEVSEQ